MKHQPRIQERADQPYLAIPLTVTMEGGFGEVVESGFSELFGWLEEHGIAPAGAPFIRFLVIDMEGDLEIELAVPVVEGVSGEGRFRADLLTAGRYGTLLHVGPYDDLIASNAALQDWAEKQGIVWDSWDTDSGSAWPCRAISHRPLGRTRSFEVGSRGRLPDRRKLSLARQSSRRAPSPA